MNRCPITYDPCGESLYSDKGLTLLSQGLTDLNLLGYTAEEQRLEAFHRGARMSIQGVQPKLSARLNIRDRLFEIVDKGGRYILKPQHQYFEQLPENEDLTMRMAAMIGLDIPVHGLVWSKDLTLTYFIKRFDRKGQKDKVPVEDFAQLAGKNRETKYNYSMEKVVQLIDTYCTFPAVEKMKLFKLVLFCYLTGNEDMHLKNFSMISRNGIAELSPCYDLLNSTIVLRNPEEEVALTIKGKKKKLTPNILINYFGKERCGLTDKVLNNTLEIISHSVPGWREIIGLSFLTEEMKEKYMDLLSSRLGILGF